MQSSMFLLEDDTILIVEYECAEKKENLLKYGHYAFRVVDKYLKLHGYIHKVVIVVIYTSDVVKAAPVLDMGSVQVTTQQVFLSRFNSNNMYRELS